MNYHKFCRLASLVAEMVKNPSAMQKTWVQLLDQEDPLEKEMATLQCSCLENSMDRGAWWATVHGAVESQTRLSDLTLSLCRLQSRG